MLENPKRPTPFARIRTLLVLQKWEQ